MNPTPYIMTPGPVRVPDFVMEALRRPPIHHRSAAFEELFARLQSGLQYLFQTQGLLLPMAGSGTFAVEMALKSLFAAGDKVLLLESGKFGERWRQYGETLGLEVRSLSVEWGKTVSVAEVVTALEAESDWKGLVVTHCETSTGVGVDLEEMVFQARERVPDLLVCADTISTIGAVPFYMDAWGVDVAFSCGQKALMNPAGTVFAALSDRALAQLTPYNKEDIFHLGRYVAAAQDLSYPVTPPTQLFYGIMAVLEQFQQQGLPTLWNQVHAVSLQCKKGIVEVGGELFGEANSDAMTAFTIPDRSAREILDELNHQYHIEIAGGQSGWKGKLLRVAHFGPEGQEGVDALLSALKSIV